MNIEVKIMTKRDEELYENFLSNNDYSMLYYSLIYREFLLKTLKNSEAHYLIVISDRNVIAVLPLILKNLKSGKTILNSLPFFGSHGGILIGANHLHKSRDITKMIFSFLSEIVKTRKSLSLTIIEPLNNNKFKNIREEYFNYFGQPAADKRIGQISDIKIDSSCDIEAELMSRFHSKTRNMVRKGLKTGFDIDFDQSAGSFDELCHLHTDNMKVIGGKPKSIEVFKNIRENFTAVSDYRIYRAKLNGKTAAMVLMFYSNKYCEYFTPVINSEFRSYQPLSALIFQAMCDAAKYKFYYWNWGGTWESQESVYFFKKRWGAKDSQYYYHNKIFDKEYLISNLETIIEEAENFYILPFTKVEELANEFN